MQEVLQKKSMLEAYNIRKFSEDKSLESHFENAKLTYEEALNSEEVDKKDRFILVSRYLAEGLVDLHIASVGSYDILYPIMTLVSLIVYFTTNYIELYILNSRLNFRIKKTRFEGKKYLLGILAACVIYFWGIRETNIIVPIVSVLTVYNFILRINNFFPGKNFLGKMKTGIIISFREIRKSVELPAAALSVIAIILSLNSNRMLIMMPVQMLFWFNFINKTTQFAGMIYRGGEKKDLTGFIINCTLEMLVWYYGSILDSIRLLGFYGAMTGGERWLYGDNYILKVFLPAIFVFFWF